MDEAVTAVEDKFSKRNYGDRAYNTDKYIYKKRNSIKFKVDLTITK